MNRHYTKPFGWGAMTPKKVVDCVNSTSAEIEKGKWVPARPEPYRSWTERIKQAWDVFTYKADALYWLEGDTK